MKITIIMCLAMIAIIIAAATMPAAMAKTYRFNECGGYETPYNKYTKDPIKKGINSIYGSYRDFSCKAPKYSRSGASNFWSWATSYD